MAFTVRVTLHGAAHSEGGYRDLHEAMRARGFSRFITGRNGRTYAMPLAEYNFEGESDIEEIWRLAIAAAKETGYDYAVLVTSGQRYWSGLESVTEP